MKFTVAKLRKIKNVVSPKGISFQQRINDRAEPDQYTYIVDYNDPNLISDYFKSPTCYLKRVNASFMKLQYNS